ncbi:MAG: tetratricopeptide repeat protein [Rhodospirillaceae bacterium]|nr:tetratricopeptide repeat protein [Rhodospirillaceae bacterium]
MKTNYYLATFFLVAGGIGLGTYLVPSGGELAMIYYRSGRLDEARKLLERELHDGDVTPSNVHYATQTYLRLGDIDRAIALVERYVAAHPDDVRARRILGGFYNDAGRQALYIANLEEIERLAPAEAQRIELATLYRAAGDYDRWAAMLDRLVADNAASPDDYLKLAQLKAAAGKRDEALAVLDLLEKRHPRQMTVAAYELRISMELDLRRPERALAWARAGVARLPDVATALTFVALFQRRGRPELGLAVLEEFAARAASDMTVLRALVSLELANGKAERALERLLVLDRAGKLTGTDRNFLIVAAVIARKWDLAKTAFEATEFDDLSEEAIDRVSREAIARDDRGAIRMILSRASQKFLEDNPIVAGQLSLLLEDRAAALRWADVAFRDKSLSGAERIDLATLYVKLDNRDRARELLKSLTADPRQIRDNAIELAALYIKLDLAADGFALLDKAAKSDDAPKLRAARALLDAKLRADARDWDLGWATLGAKVPAGAADLVAATYWAAMDAQLYPLGAALGRRLFEAAPSNETRLRYGRALALAGDARTAAEIVHPLLAESADARSIYSLALIAAVKAGNARPEEVRDFIAKQLDDPALSLADKKSLISELIDAKAYGVVLPLLEELMRRGRSEYVESYVWALTAVRDKKQLRALLQRELQKADDRAKLQALATVAFQESMFDLARPAFLRILKEDPKNLEALKRLGQMASWTGDPDHGRRYLEAFVAAGGDDYNADYALGEAIILFPDWQRATPHYRRALAKIDKLAKPTLEDLMLRAKILYRLGRFDDSVAAYEALLRRYPRDRALRNDYFDVLNEMGRYDRANQIRGGKAGR